MKFLIMQPSPASCHFLQLRCKYSPQHPLLRHPQFMFFRWVRGDVSHPQKNNKEIFLALRLLGRKVKDTKLWTERIYGKLSVKLEPILIIHINFCVKSENSEECL